jgi:hypothetical protein
MYRDLSLLHSIQTSSGAHLPSYPVSTTGSLLGRVKQSGHEPDHTPSSSAEVKNGVTIPTRCSELWLIGH